MREHLGVEDDYRQAMERGESHRQYLISCISGYHPYDNLCGAKDHGYYALNEFVDKLNYVRDMGEAYDLPVLYYWEYELIVKFLDEEFTSSNEKYYFWNALS